ncbi:phosphotransferase family protein [Spirochaeta cellobiosiphila]|uniref:phosphotransferase family protein n=1 Tax=Spirochaeta cellobiosiphila TaxID=504483 RepID=UPI000404B46C|nr:aminoglycoside phosphotransferase family protein [Spirochaeta cellobiosiphila]
MNSISKVNLSDKKLTSLIHKNFGPHINILNVKENTQGWFNALYDICLDNDQKVFLKIAPPDHIPVLRYEQQLLITEIEVLELLANYPDIPSPKVLSIDFDREVIDSDYFIMESLPGESLSSCHQSFDIETLKNIERQKGRINRSLNKITGTNFGMYGKQHKKYQTWGEAFLEMVDNILADAYDFKAKLIWPQTDIRELFIQHKSLFDQVKVPSLVHWDLHDGNVMVNASGQITGIIDCDRALWGDASIEYYFNQIYPSSDDFYSGYGIDRPNSEDFIIKRQLYDLYLTLIFVTECESRKITDKDHRSWAKDCLSTQLKKLS